MFALWSPLNNIPTKYRGLIKKSNRITPPYLRVIKTESRSIKESLPWNGPYSEDSLLYKIQWWRWNLAIRRPLLKLSNKVHGNCPVIGDAWKLAYCLYSHLSALPPKLTPIQAIWTINHFAPSHGLPQVCSHYCSSGNNKANKLLKAGPLLHTLDPFHSS